MNKSFSQRGISKLTLIGIVVAFVFLIVFINYYWGSLAASRNIKRESDLNLLKKSLEWYWLSESSYPAQDNKWCCVEEKVGEDKCDNFLEEILEYVTAVPEDPLYPRKFKTDQKYCYHYKTINNGRDYKVYIIMEKRGIIETYSPGGKEIEI